MKLALLQVEPSHLEAYFQLFSLEAVCRYMDLAPFKALSDAQDFLDFTLQQIENKKTIRYTIQVDGVLAGTICLYSIYWHQARASLGYALEPSYWHKGIMNQALRELEAKALDIYGFHRLQATVLPGNVASGRVLEKAGFTREGLLRHYEKWEGRGYVDLEMYGKILFEGSVSNG